ncbi:MAG: NAD-dependent malic enzyme [Planctomycetes bacterium]|jgi:malate dehydrogenase (oxaloacetate-decarboxylating)|nr:NAD-dependent malic enzyme [Planctomycetota bacterium]
MADSGDMRRSDPHPRATIFALRCRFPDDGGVTLRELNAAAGQVRAMMGPVSKVRAQGPGPQQETTVYVSGRGELDRFRAATAALRGLEIVAITDELALHQRGAIRMASRVTIKTLGDLRMVYTPGVASVCEEIYRDPAQAWNLTGLCDRIAIATNGTAVLGLGDIGILPSLPVMEGKAAILAELVDISGVPLLIESKDVDTFVEAVVNVAPSFGAIQIEDVAAPACFAIEDQLRARLDIPVFHDDQHGTSTVVLAALINALRQTGRQARDCTALMLGAGAAGTAITKVLLGFGIGDVVVYDSAGPLYRGRTVGMNPYKEQLAQMTNRHGFRGTLAEGFVGKDIFIGVSKPHVVSKEMIRSMAKDAIVFPLSNPIGEIDKADAVEAGAAVVADGRDINNALAYPGIFRGALDARAPDITPQMELAAAETLSQLAPAGQLLPRILDRRIHRKVAEAVLAAARA